jgi:quinoprotein glucose dehydrogenase
MSRSKEIWIHENLPGLATRGIAYWESKDRKDRRLIFAINSASPHAEGQRRYAIMSRTTVPPCAPVSRTSNP